jgi:DNA-binding CsgD family transcriptional regulator
MVTMGPLVGRESELTQLEGMLDCTRLLTVTGAGGCGKTRLVLELADRVSSREDGPECTIALLSSVASEEQLVDALLRALGARERFGSTPTQVLLPRDRPRAGWASLTPVELDVAQLAASGITNPEIAARLFIARGTVKMHLSHTYRKLGVSNRVQLAASAPGSDANPPANRLDHSAPAKRA